MTTQCSSQKKATQMWIQPSRIWWKAKIFIQVKSTFKSSLSSSSSAKPWNAILTLFQSLLELWQMEESAQSRESKYSSLRQSPIVYQLWTVAVCQTTVENSLTTLAFHPSQAFKELLWLWFQARSVSVSTLHFLINPKIVPEVFNLPNLSVINFSFMDFQLMNHWEKMIFNSTPV